MRAQRGQNLFGNPNGLPGLSVSAPRATGGPGRARGAPRGRGVPGPRQPGPLPGPNTDNSRVSSLEQRVNAAENSNRSLLDELLRTQQEMRMTVKKNEHGLHEEKDARNRTDAAVRQLLGRVAELEDRTRNAESTVRESRNTVSQLLGHTKSVEKAVMTAQQDIVTRKDQQMQRLQEFKHHMAAQNQNKELLERNVFSLRDEVRDMAGKVDTLQLDVASINNSLQLTSRAKQERKMMKQVNSNATDSAKLSEFQKQSIEAKILALQQIVMDMQSKIKFEQKTREQSEVYSGQRMQELFTEIADIRRRKEEELQDSELKFQAASAMGANDRQTLAMQISNATTELQHDMSLKHSKLKNDIQGQITSVEKGLKEDLNKNTQDLRKIKEEVGSQLSQNSTYGEEGLVGLRKLIDDERTQSRAKIQEVKEGQSALQMKLHDTQLELDKLKSDDSNTKANEVKVLGAKVNDLNDRLTLGMLTLQSSLGEAGQKNGTGLSMEEVKRLKEEDVKGMREETAKTLGEMDKKVKELDTKLDHHEKDVEAKLKALETAGNEETTLMGDKLQQGVDSVTFSYHRLRKQVDDMNDQVKNLPQEMDDLKQEVEEKEGTLKKKMDEQNKAREADIEEIREKLDRDRRKSEAQPVSNAEMEHMEEEIKVLRGGMQKLSEAITITKSVLAEKFREEKGERRKENSELSKDFRRLYDKYDDLKERIKGKRNDYDD